MLYGLLIIPNKKSILYDCHISQIISLVETQQNVV